MGCGVDRPPRAAGSRPAGAVAVRVRPPDCGSDAPAVVRALLYASAVGGYRAAVNGRDVDDHVLAPGWTPYSSRTVHDTVEVTSLVRAGRNCLSLRAAGLWATEHFGFRQNARPRYGDQPRVAAQLLLEFADGSRRWVRTDASWTASTGALLASGLYAGETYDARAQPVDAAAGNGTNRGSMTARGRRRACIHVRRFPVRGSRPRAADRAAASGRADRDRRRRDDPRLRSESRGPAAPARRGPPGYADHAPSRRSARARSPRHASASPRRGDRPLHARGHRTEVWEPEFTFHGFRYAEVSGWPGEIAEGAVTAVVVHSDLERTGSFRTSHPLLQRLHDNVVWSLRGNVVSIPTDCPQRDERLGWTGDIQVFAPTAAFLYDVRGFLDSWLRDLALEQAADGTVPFVVPDVIGIARPAAAWGDAAVIVPDVLERLLGDADTVRRQYPSAKAWVDRCLEWPDRHASGRGASSSATGSTPPRRRIGRRRR